MMRTLSILLLAIVLKDSYPGNLVSHGFILLAGIITLCAFTFEYLMQKKLSETKHTSTIKFKNVNRLK